jgi:polyisoprenyl-phosphate glycosyltransferase
VSLPPEDALHVVIPIYNDWSVVVLLLPKLETALAEAGLSAHVVLVDDGSTERPFELAIPTSPAMPSVSVLELRRNLGHQRAIAIGLTYLHAKLQPTAVVVMDGDGEDAPEDVPRLVARMHDERERKVVFAQRTRRSEPLFFKLGYRAYRILHFALTGYRVRVGNFSAIPAAALSRLVVVSEMWNHYAAAVYNARIDHVMIPSPRGKRLGGHSKMNFISLVVHGLSALSVYGHIIGVRLVVVAGVLIATTSAGLLAIVGLKLFSTTPVPSWLPLMAAILLVLLLQSVTAAVVFVFVMLSGRQGATFIPLRDYELFVQRLVRVAPPS